MRNMISGKRVGSEELRAILLSGLRYFADFCERNHLEYYLAYGTLLGAVRHKGFIPWDDDIDVWMPRKDYDRLISLFVQDINNQDWELLSFEINPKYCFPWAKLCHKHTLVTPSRFNNGFLYGLSIDVFPQDTNSTATDRYDFVKDFDALKNRYQRKIKTYFLFRDDRNIFVRILKQCIARVRAATGSYISLMEAYSSQLRVITRENTTWYGAVNYHDFQKREWFDETMLAEFEGYTFTIPKYYKNILTARYGDYMKLPPEEERVSNHDFIAYYK